MTEASYTAWDDKQYVWPPPDGWYLAADAKWWPEGYGPPPQELTEPALADPVSAEAMDSDANSEAVDSLTSEASIDGDAGSEARIDDRAAETIAMSSDSIGLGTASAQASLAATGAFDSGPGFASVLDTEQESDPAPSDGDAADPAGDEVPVSDGRVSISDVEGMPTTDIEALPNGEVKLDASGESPSISAPGLGDFRAPDGGDIPVPGLGDFRTPDPGEISSPDLGDLSAPDLGDLPAPDLGDLSAPDLGDLPATDFGGLPGPAVGDVAHVDLGDLPAPDLGDLPAPDLGDLSASDLGDLPAPGTSVPDIGDVVPGLNDPRPPVDDLTSNLGADLADGAAGSGQEVELGDLSPTDGLPGLGDVPGLEADDAPIPSIRDLASPDLDLTDIIADDSGVDADATQVIPTDIAEQFADSTPPPPGTDPSDISATAGEFQSSHGDASAAGDEAALTQASVFDSPAADPSASDAPDADRSVFDSPTADSALSDPPGADSAVSDSPTADSAVSDSPTADSAVSDSPDAAAWASDTQASGVQSDEASGSDAPTSDGPAFGAPGFEAPAVDAGPPDDGPPEAATFGSPGNQGPTIDAPTAGAHPVEGLPFDGQSFGTPTGQPDPGLAPPQEGAGGQPSQFADAVPPDQTGQPLQSDPQQPQQAIPGFGPPGGDGVGFQPGELLAAKPKGGRTKKLLLVLLGVLALGAICFALYLLVRDNNDSSADGAAEATGPGSVNEPHARATGVVVFYPDGGTDQRWVIEVLEPVRDASQEVIDGGSSSPEEGEIFAATRVRVRNDSGVDGASLADLRFNAVNAAGDVVVRVDNQCSPSVEDLDYAAMVPIGSEVEGDVCWSIPASELDGLKLGLESEKVAGRVHIALQ